MELQNEDIFLGEGNLGEDQQQQQPEPPAKQLWQELNRAEYYTKPFEEFQKQFGNRDAASSLWKELNKAEYYTKDEKEFVNQFFPDLKKKVGSVVVGESSGISDSEAQSISRNSAETPNIYKTIDGREIPDNDIVSLSKEANRLEQKRDLMAEQSPEFMISPMPGAWMMPTENPESEKESKVVREIVKTKGYDPDEVFNDYRDIPDEIAKQQGFRLEDKEFNPQMYYRKLGAAAWQSNLKNSIDVWEKMGDISSEDAAKVKELVYNSTIPGKTYSQRRQITADLSAAISSYIPDEEKRKRLLSNLATDRSISYGVLSPEDKQVIENSPEREYLDFDQTLGYQYLEDTDPEIAKGYKDLFVSDKAIDAEGNARAGWQFKASRLKTIGLQIQQSAVQEQINNLKNLFDQQNGELSPEQQAKYEELQLESERLKSESAQIPIKYPFPAQYNAVQNAQEILGSQLIEKGGVFGSPLWLLGKTSESIVNTGKGMLDLAWEAVNGSESEASKVQRLAVLGEQKMLESIYQIPQKDQAMKSFDVVTSPEIKSQIDAIKNDKNLSYDDKLKKIVDIQIKNPGAISRLPIHNGKLDINPTTMFYAAGELASAIVPYIGLEAITGGGATAGLARKFASSFNAAFLTGFRDAYAAAIDKGVDNPYTYAIRNTAINSLAMAGAGTPQMIKQLAGTKSAIGQVINNMSNKSIQEMIDIGNKSISLFGKSIKTRPLVNAATAVGEKALEGMGGFTKFEAAMLPAKVLNKKLNDEEINPEEMLKESVVMIATGGIVGLTGARERYKQLNDIDKGGYLKAAENPQAHIETAQKMLVDGLMTREDYDKAVSNIKLASEVSGRTKFVDNNGNELSQKKKADLLLLKMQEAELQKQTMGDVPDKLREKVRQENEELKSEMDKVYESEVPEQQKQSGITEISSEEVKPQIGEVVRTETNQPVSEVAEIPEGQGTKETVSEGSNAVGQGKSEATTTVLSEREVVPTEKSTEGKEVELPVTKSGLTEVEREKLIQEREKKTAIPEKDKETQDILNDISKYNKLPNGRLGKLKPEGLKSLNKIREKVRAFNDKHGTNYSFDDRAGKLYDKNKKGLTGAVKGKNVYDPDSGIDRSGKPLRERDKDVIDAFDQLMEVGALPTGYGTDGRRMSSSQLDATVQDILDGIPSRRANNYLDALEKMVREDDFDFSQPDFPQTNKISLSDIVGIEKETATEPMTEQQIDKWLEDESKMTREDERLFDNIENLINEYEIENGFEREVEQPPATTETKVSAETQPNEKGRGATTESTGTGKESGKVESPESEKPGAGEGAPPNEPPKSEFSFIYEGSEKKRVSGLMRHIQESEKVSEETKRAFKEKGIEYKTADNREARKVASEIIDSVGRDNALALARGNDLHPSVRSAIYAESIDRAYAAEKSAKTKEEADEAAIQWAEISREYDKMLTQGGQFTSYAGHFYKTSPMGFVLKAEADRKQRFEEWYGTKEKDFKEVFDELLKETGGREEFDKRVEEIRKEERKKSRAAKKKKIDDFFDSMKVKDDVVYSSIIPPQLYNGAVEVIKQAVQAGETIANAIAQGVQHISKSVGDKWDKEKFARGWNDRFSMQGFDEGGKSYSQTLKDKIAELERRMKEKDFSAEKAKQKKDMTDEEKQLLDEYAEVKSRYDEARKKSAEWSEKQALKFLDRFKKKVAGLNETQKKEVVRKSIKELSENGVLQYDDFKKIVADALGMKEFTKEKVAEIESLVNDINADATAEDAMVENPTKENYDKFVASREKAIEAQNKLYQITNTGVDLTQTFRSVLTGNLLSVFTLIKNVAQNVVYQSTIRFPKAVMRSIVELGVYGMSKAIPGSKTFSPKSNVLLAQYGYFKGLAAGKRRGVFMFKKGLQERDISSKEAYQSTLSPKRAKEELRMWKAGEIFLTKAEVLDRRIKTMWFSKQADFILRGMGLGDNVQRWGAEFSSALQVAVNEFKIDVTDEGKILSFISAPEKTAYKLFIEQGKSEKEARELAAEVKNQIVREGDRSVLQEENLLSKASSAIDRSLKTVKDESPFSKTAKAVGSVTKTMTFPFVKIPANVFWQMFKIANPEFSLAYSIAQSAAAAKYKKEGDLAKAREYNDKAIDSALTAMYGYGIGIMASSLVANGLVRGSNDEDKSYRETAGEKVFGKQYQLNFGKMIGSKDYWVDLSWFGPFGGVLDVKARMFDDKLDRKQKGEPEELSYINELTDNFSYSLTSSLNSLVFDQAGKTYNAIAGGEKGVKVFTVNTVNNVQNILTGATYSAISKAYLPEQAQLKADNVIEEIKNNAKARNIIVRQFAGRPTSKISMWGEPIKNDNSASGIFSNIFGFESGSENKFGAIIYDDYLKTGNDKFFPMPVSNTIQVNGKSMKLSTEEHRKLQTYVGQARKELVSAFVYDKSKFYEGKTYSQLSDLDKVKALDMVYDMGLDFGKEKFYHDFPQYKPKTKFDKTIDEIMEEKQGKMEDKMFKNQFK